MASYTFNYPTADSFCLPNGYLQSILDSFQPRRGDQTILEFIGKTVYEDTVACLASMPSLALDDTVFGDAIRPSRPRNLPAETLPTEGAAIRRATAAAPTLDVQQSQTNSYATFGDYARSFYSDVPTAKAQPSTTSTYHTSAYSELSANLVFLAEINNNTPATSEDSVAMSEYGPAYVTTNTYYYPSPPPISEAQEGVWPSEPTIPFHLPTSAYASTPGPSSPNHPATAKTPPKRLNPYPPPPHRRHKTLQKAVESLQSQAAMAADIKRKHASKASGPGPTSPGQPASQVLKRLLEAKKHKVACLFCRERKIACGNPGEDARDRTCDQCRKRRLPCTYPTECRRGIRGVRPNSTTRASGSFSAQF